VTVQEKPNIMKAVSEYYDQTDESQRLFAGVGELERIRTQSILSRYLPAAPAVVVDVGGAAGVHALWLADQGYEVHLFDPVALHVGQAREASKKQASKPLRTVQLGEARSIDRADESADAVLLLGPLYHLPKRVDRIQALLEARRVLRPGGRIVSATISRFGSLLDGLARDLVADPVFVRILRQDLEDGQHRNRTGKTEYFTTAYFHDPAEVKDELVEAGFRFEKLLSVEGPAWVLPTFAEHWGDPDKRALLLELIKAVEEEPSLLGVSAHLLAVATRAG
jgi:SAM-dependent methyltransferase